MKNPRDYLGEVQANLQKLRSQKQVTATENALFGMIDGLAGLLLVTLERVTALEQAAGTQPPERHGNGLEAGASELPPPPPPA
jgi:hypothetical protein